MNVTGVQTCALPISGAVDEMTITWANSDSGTFVLISDGLEVERAVDAAVGVVIETIEELRTDAAYAVD